MIVIVDYGMGNLRSAQKGFEKAGHEARISDRPEDIEPAAGIVLPGVGAFGDCYNGLSEQGFVEPLTAAAAAGKPLLGICVGMQLLFEESTEGAGSRGLGILPGRVVRFPPAAESGLKVPHMGWNRIDPVAGGPCSILKNLGEDPYVYFVHSYYPEPESRDTVYAETEYGITFPSVVGRDNVFGTQFHPEKSQHEGIGILSAFGDYVHGVSESATV